MKSGSVPYKEGYLLKGSNSAAIECRRAAVLERMERCRCLADGTPHSYRRQLQCEVQQIRRRESDRQPRRQRKHLDQQKDRHAFEQTRRQQLHTQQKNRQSQQQMRQQSGPHKRSQSNRNKKKQPTPHYLPQRGHVFTQYKREGRHTTRLLVALLLLVLRRVPVRRSFAEFSCGVFFVSLPASGAVAVTGACASLAQTDQQLKPLPMHTSSAAASAGAKTARRLEDERGARPDQTERMERHDIGAQKKAEHEKVGKLSSVPGTQERRRGAEEAGSLGLLEAGRIQRTTSIDASSIATTKEKAEVTTQRVRLQKPPAKTGKKNVETSTAYERGTLASPDYDQTAYEGADKGAGKARKKEEKAPKPLRSEGAVARTNSARVDKGVEKANKYDVAQKLTRKSQRITKREKAQEKVAASAHEGKGKGTSMSQPHRSKTKQDERQHPAARDRHKGLHALETEDKVTDESRTSASSTASFSESASSSLGNLGTGPPENAKKNSRAEGELLLVKSSFPDSVAAGNTPESPVSSPDVAGSSGEPSNLNSNTSSSTGTPEGAQLPEGGGPTEEASSLEPLHAQADKATGAAGGAAQNSLNKSVASGGDSPESAKKAPAEPAAEVPRMLRERLVEQRVAALEEQTRSAEKLIQAAAEEQQRLFTAFEERVQAVTEQLTAVQTGIDGLNQMLSNVGEHLAREKERQQALFNEDIQRSIEAVGLNSAALRQAELSGKLNALQGMHDNLSDKMQSLAKSLQDMEENRQARLETQTQKLQKFVEGRTSLAIAQLVTDAKQCVAGMQQQLNDAKLDQILLTQAAKEAEERLREQRFAAVDISHVNESMSFQGITSAFAALLQATFPRKDLMLIYIVTVRPQTLANVAYANVFLVPSAENTRRLLSVGAADPSLSEMVVKVESIMIEAWRIFPQRAHVQYMVPTPQEGLRMAGSVEYVYELMKTMHKVTQEKHLNGEMTEGRPGILVYTGMRQGVEAPADTPHTEFKKLQILRNLVTMYTSPVQETARLWQIMRNEVHLLDIFAPLQPIEVDGCHLRVYGGVAPLPEIPNSPFIKGAIMFVRLELTRSGTRYFLFPNPGLWLKILQYLTLMDTTDLGTFAVIKARVVKVSWIRSRMQRLFQSQPRAELSVHVHDYHRTTQPSELQASEMKGIRRKSNGASSASSELHKGLAEAVESVTDTLAQSVLPQTARKGFTTRRHLFVHVCESNVSCGTQESP